MQPPLRLKQSLIAIFVALAALPAAAQQWPRWYVGISGGQSDTSNDLVKNRESTIVNGESAGSQFDSTDGAWKIFGGWQMNEMFALEATYADLGSTHLVTETVSTTNVPGTFDMHRKVDGFGLDGVIKGPFAPGLSAFARGGAFWSRTKSDASLSGGIVFTDDPTARSRSVTYNEAVGHLGIGAEWDFQPNAALRLEWERFFNVGKAFQQGATGTTGEADVDLFTLGVLMRF
jgi:OOP family OmpA-OmpF porin